MRLLPVLSLFFTAVYTRDTDQQAQVVLYTAGVSCKPCELVNKQFGYLASSAVQFRRIDYSIETKDQFKRAGIEGIPEIKLLLPGQDVDSWSLTRNGNLKSLAESLNSKGFKTQYNEPVDYARLAQTALSVVAGLLLIRSVGPHLWKALAQRTIWRSLSLLFISVMTSGYMWVTIRTPPFIGQLDEKPVFIIDQFQSQLGIETFIVAATYSIVSFSVVMLIYGVPKMQNQRTGVYALVTCFMIGLSVLYYLFRVKNSSYPFKLLL